MPSISLHIGLAKTATSYVQAWLYQNRRLLLERGIILPERPVLPHRLAAEHLRGGVWENRADVLEIRKTPLDDAERFVESALRSESAVAAIISSEYFYHADPQKVVQQFRKLTASEIDVVVFIRSQGNLALSGYNQDVKRLAKTTSRPRPEYHPYYDWGILLDSWAQAVGRQHLKVISFDLSARAGTIVQDFVAAACPTIARDLAEGAFADSTAFNESLPADLLEFKRIANLWGEVGLADWLEEALRAGYAGPRFGVNAEEADAWRAIYEPSNQRIAREYFAASKASDIFPVTEARDRGTVLEGQLGAETLAKLFAFALMREQNRFKEAEARMKALELQVASIRARLGENQ